MGRRWGRAIAVMTISGVITMAACVGDEPATTGGDDGGSQNGDGGLAQDTSTGDGSAGGDGAGPTTCDPNAAFGAATAVDELNAIGSAQEARLSRDGLFVYFSAEKLDAGGDFDIYQGQRTGPSGPFSNIAAIQSAKQANYIESAPSISGDGLVLYFAGMSTTGDGFAIFSVTRGSLAEQFIASPHFLGQPIDAIGDAGPFPNNAEPFLADDGSQLYFVSARNSTYYHVFRGDSLSDGGFTNVAPVSEVNIGREMEYPTLSADGLVIYFAANLGPDGGVQTDLDIFVGTRASSSGAFSNIHRVTDLSTPYDDYPDYVSADKCTVYLHRRTNGGSGPLETIYRAVKNP